VIINIHSINYIDDKYDNNYDVVDDDDDENDDDDDDYDGECVR